MDNNCPISFSDKFNSYRVFGSCLKRNIFSNYPIYVVYKREPLYLDGAKYNGSLYKRLRDCYLFSSAEKRVKISEKSFDSVGSGAMQV